MEAHTMSESKNNSIDFEQLMQDLLELEKKHPDHPDIQVMKEKIQQEVDRRSTGSQEPGSDVSANDTADDQDASAILDSIYSTAKEKQQASPKHSHHSGHHHSSHSRHHSSGTSHHYRHHTVITSSLDLSSENIDFEDLVYQEDDDAGNGARKKTSSKTYLPGSDPVDTKARTTDGKPSSKSDGNGVHSRKHSGSSSRKPSDVQSSEKRNVSSAKNSSTNQKGWRSWKRWQRTASVVLGILLLFVIAGACTFQYLMNRIPRIDPDEIPELSKEGLEDLLTLSREELEKLRDTDPDAESLIIDKKDRYGVGDVNITPMQRDDVLNILLIGQDRRKGDKGQMRSDSMILVTIDKSSNEIKLTSLMRDMYVPVPDYGYGMINATLLNGGMKLLNATIEQDLGVHIDGDIQIDFYRFIKLMDLVGPLDIELNTDEVKYFNENHGWNLVEGVNSLNSEQVLAYCRVRKVGRSDWERTDRQRRVIQTIYSKLKKSDIPTLIQFAYNAMPLITTNIDKNSELISIIYTILRNHMPITKSSRIPLEGTYTQEVKDGVLHVLVPDLYPNAKALQTIAFGYSNIKYG